MSEISNKVLSFFIVASIAFSLFTTIVTLNRLDMLRGKEIVTGKAGSDFGNVTITVDTSLSIRLIPPNHVVDFGSGYFNQTPSACSSARSAILYAGATYNDTDGEWCWTNYTAQPTSLILENDGNVNVNVTVRGPANDSFFQGYTEGDPYGLEFKVRNEQPGSCTTDIQDTFIDFGGVVRDVCGNFLFTPGTNRLGVDIKLVIPASLSPGTYENASIEFTAFQN